jgi:hypothetical protein
MSCRVLRTWVWRQGADALPAPLEDHVARCSRCRSLVESVRLLDQTVVESAEGDPGAPYWESFPVRVQRQLQAPSQVTVRVTPARPRWRWVWNWAPAVGVAVLALLIGREVIRERTAPVVTETEVPVVREAGTPATALATPTGEMATPSGARPDATRVPGPKRSAERRGAALAERSSERPGTQMTQPSVPGMAKLSAPTTGQSPTASEVGQSPEGAGTQPAQPLRSTDEGRVWPERQVTIMGQVATDTPRQPLADERGPAAQGAFGAYERQMAQGGAGTETTGIFAVPGRLLEAPRHPTPAGFADSQSPAEAMRRFDEIAELRRSIGRIQALAPADRSAADQAQLPAFWYRLGMITGETMLVDSAIQIAGGYLSTLSDPQTLGEWAVKRDRLVSRRAAMAH